MSFTQTQIQPTSFDQFPFAPGSKLGAVALNDAFLFLQNQVTNLQNQVAALQRDGIESDLGVSITVDWGGGTTPTAGPFVLTPTAPYEFTIVNMDMNVGDRGGSFDVHVLNNGLAIGGFSVNVNSPLKTNVVALSNNVVPKGGELDVVVSNIVGSPANCYLCLNGTTNAVSEPLAGVGAGTARGDTLALGVGTSTLTNGAFATATGQAIVGAFAMAAFQGLAQATGGATVQAAGFGILANTRIGTAVGGSVVQAVGSAQVGPTPLALDIGQLDINPLG